MYISYSGFSLCVIAAQLAPQLIPFLLLSVRLLALLFLGFSSRNIADSSTWSLTDGCLPLSEWVSIASFLPRATSDRELVFCYWKDSEWERYSPPYNSPLKPLSLKNSSELPLQFSHLFV